MDAVRASEYGTLFRPDNFVYVADNIIFLKER